MLYRCKVNSEFLVKLFIACAFSLLIVFIFYPSNASAEECEHYLYGDEVVKYTKIDNQRHRMEYTCSDCGEHVSQIEDHYTVDFENKCEKVNDSVHRWVERCDYCGANYYSKAFKHYWTEDVQRYATPKKDGIKKYDCFECGAHKTRIVKFKRGTWYSKSYEIKDHSDVWRNSKKMWVKLANPLKGAVVKVKIGKRVYKKVIKTNKRKIKLRIKKPKKYGKRVKYYFKLLYKGKIVGVDACEGDDHRVWYAKKIKKGMTKKQVRYTWGKPSKRARDSDGWSYWYYDDGSFVYFKNGRVRTWYESDY